MTYSASKYQLTHLLQDAWMRMGQLRRWNVTGGSQTTVINTDWAGVEEQTYEDDDPALIYGTVVVIKSTDGLAPEGEMAMITDYDSSSQTITMDSLSAAVGVGDRVGTASPLLPLEDMIELANLALMRLGEIDLVDTSLSVVANQTEYSLPANINHPVAVHVQGFDASGNNLWRPVQGWFILPATTDSQWTLIVPDHLSANMNLMIEYRAPHPTLTAYDSTILGTIKPELAVCALVAEAYQWYNNQVGGSSQYFLQRENKALQDLEAAKVLYPIRRRVEQVQGFVHWGRSGDYVPLTSDRLT